MWDLDTLRYLNELAYQSSLKVIYGELGLPTSPEPSPGGTATLIPEPVFPLALLAAKLITGPPSLARLIDFIEGSDAIADFLSLIREFLPENEAEIMSEIDDESRIERFRRCFNPRYFPLSEVDTFYDDFTLSDFIRQIPVDLMGFTADDYEQFNEVREGFILLLSLCESPYIDRSERIPLLERVKELVGKGLVELIPPDGWDYDDIHRMLDNTEYEGAVAFADWIFSSTDCWQLDANYMDYSPEAWSRELVNGLTAQWPTVVDLQAKMQRMFEWLEEDMYHNFEKLLATMLGLRVEMVPKEQMPFPLDDEGQVIEEEVIAIGRR